VEFLPPVPPQSHRQARSVRHLQSPRPLHSPLRCSRCRYHRYFLRLPAPLRAVLPLDLQVPTRWLVEEMGQEVRVNEAGG